MYNRYFKNRKRKVEGKKILKEAVFFLSLNQKYENGSKKR